MPPSKLTIPFSSRTKNLAKFKASFPQIVFAQLIVDGYKPAEAAWATRFAFSKTTDGKAVEQAGKLMMESETVITLINHFKKERGGDKQTTDQTKSTLDELIAQRIQETGEMDKDATAMEILRMAQGMPDCKEKADLMMKYADLRGFKKAEDKVIEDNTVHFVLPVSCSNCPCRQFAMEHGNDEDKKPLNASK